MPEGPEVETVRLGLLGVIGQKIMKVELAREDKFFNNRQSDLIALKGSRIESIERFGKTLIWKFKGEKTQFVLNHLGMTGSWYYFSKVSWNSVVDQYKHFKVYFKLSDGSHLIFENIRKFGKFLPVTLEEIQNNRSISNLGPDILKRPFEIEIFMQKLKNRKKEIGRALLDYTIIAGCGNIYKSEALFRAKINPFRKVNSLTNHEIEVLAGELVAVTDEAMVNKGSSLRDYKQVDGYSGMMQNQFRVYGLDGKPCVVCKNPIIREIQGDRSTFYCSSCQK